MSSMDTALLHIESARISRTSRAAALRLMLLRSEALRVPKRLSRLRVLSGTAWISLDGRDLVLEAGQTVELAELKTPAVVSAIGCAAVLFEVW